MCPRPVSETVGVTRRVIVDREKVRELHGQDNSVRVIADQLGLTKSTVHSIVDVLTTFRPGIPGQKRFYF